MHILVAAFLLPLKGFIICMSSNLGGSWELLLNNTGIVAMHMTLTHKNTVIIFDQTRTGRSGYHLHNTKNVHTTTTMAIPLCFGLIPLSMILTPTPFAPSIFDLIHGAPQVRNYISTATSYLLS